ncbi:MAG: hypothetical protein COA84_08885 [Robiginitomaculum sp.]|nr:MAG: hypothetical protein COA84_08885 [Robiginitomaculum sp.]
MSGFRIGLIAFASAVVAALVCFTLQFQSKPKYGRLTDLAYFNSMPVQKFMSETEYKYYTRALNNLDCDLAGILLNTAFIRQYPQFQSSQLKRECGAEKGCLFWDISAGVVFDEYGYCRAASGFNEADNEIRIQGLTPPKFSAQITLYGKSDENYWIKIRSNNTIMLINYANGDYVPALIKIGELLHRGDIFVPSKEAEYYVLRRACVLSAEACVDLAPRLARLKADLPPDRAVRVEQAASDDPSLKPPFLVDVLLTGKV